MIDWAKRVNLSGLDLNAEVQTSGLLRTSAEGSHASRHARVRTGDGAFASEHLSPLLSGASRRSQGAGILLPRSVLSNGLRSVDRSRVVARLRSELACEGRRACTTWDFAARRICATGTREPLFLFKSNFC